MTRSLIPAAPCLAVAAALLLPASGSGQTPAGTEFQVNTYTTNRQERPRVAFAGDDFVVTWLSRETHPDLPDVMARRYAPDGTPLTGEFRVSGPLLDGALGGIASSAGGEFAVVWYAKVVPDPHGSYYGVVGRRSDAGGVMGEPFVLGPPYPSLYPDVAMDPAGRFVVVWESQRGSGLWRISGQRFDASGAPTGAEFAVSPLAGPGRAVAASVSAAGGFVVWDSPDGDGEGVFGRRMDATGVPLGTEFRVNDFTTARQRRPRVTVAPSGGAVVIWQDSRPVTGAFDLYGQRLDAAGAPIGGEFRVTTYAAYPLLGTSVASNNAGDFVVAWDTVLADGRGPGVFARRFRADGVPRGAEFRVNTHTTGAKSHASVGSDRDGNLVVAWSSDLQDGSSYGVYGQRYGGLHAAALAIDPKANGVFEPGESVEVAPSWRNVNAAAATFSGMLARFTGPAPASYQIVDGAGDYGTVSGGTAAQCGDCYQVAVPAGVRPAVHWDAALEERLLPEAHGQSRLWSVHLGSSFTDVPSSSPYYRFVETLLHRSITSGCGGSTYCPLGSATREQMAAFVLVGKEGPGYRPRACGAPLFLDVPADSPFCPFVEELARRGIVGGCGGGSYCPSAAVTREQMPVFVLRTLDPTLDPPVCTVPLFADVPAGSPFCRWIEELARRGIVGGCGGGNYCPGAPVTREQMAAFIAPTFGLTLYGP